MNATAIGVLAGVALALHRLRARSRSSNNDQAHVRFSHFDDLEDSVKFFAENGYLVLRNFVDAKTLEGLARQVELAIADKSKVVKAVPFRALSDATVFKDLRDSSFSVELFGASPQLVDTIGHGFHWSSHPENFANAVATSKEMERLLRKLVGMKDPRVVQTKFVMKLPKIGAKVPTHADEQYVYSNDPSSPGLALWVPLDPAQASNGALKVIPKSHLEYKPGERFAEDSLRSCAKWSPPPSTGFFPCGTRTKPFPYGKKEIESLDWTLLPCAPGDAVFMHSALLHASDANKSNLPRRAFTAHYVDGRDDENWGTDSWIPRPPQGFPRVGC